MGEEGERGGEEGDRLVGSGDEPRDVDLEDGVEFGFSPGKRNVSGE